MTNPTDQVSPERLESLGPAERIVQMLSNFTDHLRHNRPGFVTDDPNSPWGTSWQQATWKAQEDGTKVVSTVRKVGKRTLKTNVGNLDADGKTVRDALGNIVGEYRKPGLYPEVAAFLYRQIAEVWKLDAEFSAHLASWVFAQDRRDLKTIAAAFMLSQSYAGQPVTEGGEVIFYEDDFRAVGEAMLLLRKKGQDLTPKQVLQVGEVLCVPAIHEVNRALGFTKSAKNPNLKRWKKAVKRWLRYRENNPRMLEGLVKSGQSNLVRTLAQRCGYKPSSEEFFRVLNWKQKQSPEGHRAIGLDMETSVQETWEGKTEAEICRAIVADQPGWKVIVGKLPSSVGVTPAIFAAAVEAGALSNKDLIILTPTIEELGLIDKEPVASAWKRAIQAAEDQRARNIALRVRSQEAKDGLEEAADVATAKAMEEATRNLRVWVAIDISSSMSRSLVQGKELLSKFLGGFPLDRTHVSVFNTVGREVTIRAPKRAAVVHALDKFRASGGTKYLAGLAPLERHKPQEDEDLLILWVGDQAGEDGAVLARIMQQSGINPVAFGFLELPGHRGNTVDTCAAALGIPCFRIQPDMFDDPYAVTQVLKNLISSTPTASPAMMVPRTPRKTLVQQVLETPLLQRPNWAQ
jgi:hypothetical protein